MKWIKKMLFWISVALVVAFIGLASYIRFAGDDVAHWHKDPATAVERGKKNDFIVSPEGAGVDMASPVFDMQPEALQSRFEEVALGAPRTSKLSGEGGFSTYVQRSKLMAYPDYISVKAVPVDGGAALYIYSRSRYGESDFDVNKKRILAWLDRL
jgi:uncharacterized protein (DUF1499 family)